MAGRSLDDTPVRGNKSKWSDYSERFEFKDDEWHLVRFFGPVFVDHRHTVETKSGKYYPEFCLGWDADACDFYPDREARCPICAILAKDPSIKSRIKSGDRYYMNLIDLEIEENKPQNPKASWTPIRMIELPITAFQKLRELKVPNKGVSVENVKGGAVLQIKYNPKTDPAKQYNVTMDTKNVPITKEQAAYVIIQKYPDQEPKTVKGENGLPPYFDYIRIVNQRSEIESSLRRNGYYEGSVAEIISDGYEREAKVARVAAEAPVESVSFDDDEPAAKPEKVAVVEKPKTQKSNTPYEDCPTSFGEFASTSECYTKCGVVAQCRAASEAEVEDEKPVTKPAKKVQANVQTDDDDSV